MTRPTRATPRPPRALYLAFYFPPSRASGVFRARATANLLAERGWEVTVHSAPREFFARYIDSYDASLEASVHPAVRVERPPMSYFRWERDLRRYGPLRANLPVLANAAYNWAQANVFPEHYASWIPHVLRHALRAHLRRPFDVVIASGNPFASFAAAWLIGRLTRVPYVLDYRDAWTFNQFTEELKFPPRSRAWEWEARVLRDAAEVVFVNEGMLRWHAERYPFAAGRMRVVPNGWEPEILGAASGAATAGEASGGGRRPGPLRFGYLGTVTSYMPLEELFDGWRLARAHPELADAELLVHGHLGFFPHDAAPLMERIPTGEGLGVSYRGPVEKARVGEVYRDLDVLLFCVPGARYVTTGKVFEYMATGKPVVSVHRPGIAAEEVLRGYPLWFAGEELDAADVAASMVAAARAARTLTPARTRAARAHAARFTRAATLTPWERRLRALAASRGAQVGAASGSDAGTGADAGERLLHGEGARR
ncbi:glycosyltransferase [Allostreptomyces psammosilenae]|uniref:Glycosyltransferase involved in cell wall biosynthesis n=1 Tax=Allostreptomyces psammosilenae TaxID=1892865 RepID=A0A853A213_9ACTN|nr:glycosyltransferase [Allostreptomyces psammosilenae]NYI08475.1 glycosyltransferase involved in cell wall biosynthesis [Allostreptomyces psammosilenae]